VRIRRLSREHLVFRVPFRIRTCRPIERRTDREDTSMRRSSFLPATWRTLFVALACSLLFPLASVSAAPGDRDDPVEPGDAGAFGTWEIVVENYEGDATETVMGDYAYNAEPKAGHQYALVTFEIANTGEEALDPAVDLTISAVGERLVGYSGFSSWCYIETDLYVVGEIEPGDSAAFQMCWMIAEEDADSLVVNVTSFFSNDLDPLWLSLGNDFVVPDEAPEIDVEVIEASTEDDPLAMDTWGQIGDVLISVDAVKVDAFENLQAFDSSFQAPNPGEVYVLIRIGAMYVGDETSRVTSDLTFVFLDRQGETYDAWENGCSGFVPDDQYSVPDLYPGGEAAFNSCIALPEDEAATTVMQVTGFDSGSEPVYFSLAE
jgi:hypothetical protein